MDSIGPFPLDTNANKYLITAQDPFGKWAETRKTPSLRSWWAAEFLLDIIAQWGKPHYVKWTLDQNFQVLLLSYAGNLR